jgi:hypothetical protein
MAQDACHKVSGMKLVAILQQLGPPDWIGTPDSYFKPGSRKNLQGTCIIGYYLEPNHETSFCLSVFPDSKLETCFESFWDERIELARHSG